MRQGSAAWLYFLADNFMDSFDHCIQLQEDLEVIKAQNLEPYFVEPIIT